MELKRLLEGVEVRKIVGDPLKRVEGIAYHSKQIDKGFLFAAIRGVEVDGHRFIEEAIQRGAEVVVSEEEREVSDGTMILVPNSRQALAKISIKLLWRSFVPAQAHRGHRDQWKDDDHLSFGIDSEEGRGHGWRDRNDQLSVRPKRHSRSKHDAGVSGSSKNALGDGRGRDFPCHHGGLFPRARSGSGLRMPVRRRGLYESHPRSS